MLKKFETLLFFSTYKNFTIKKNKIKVMLSLDLIRVAKKQEPWNLSKFEKKTGT